MIDSFYVAWRYLSFNWARKLVQYNEVTPENIASFHFHGDPANSPTVSSTPRATVRTPKTDNVGQYRSPTARRERVATLPPLRHCGAQPEGLLVPQVPYQARCI
jgi:hypothetical protein